MTDVTSSARGGAKIFDRGYRRYEGERRGVRGAFFTLYLATLQRVLGLRRGAKAKILPVIVIAISYLPAIVFVGIAALFPKRLSEGLPGYHEYYGTVIFAILLFAAFVAPEALCPDRRYRILGVYLASPLSRLSYVLAKLLAVFTVMCAVTIGPVLLLALARSLLDRGVPMSEFPLLLLRIFIAGVGVALFYSLLSLAVSSLTDRKGFASAGFILMTIVSQAVGGVLGFAQIGSNGPRPAVLISTLITPNVFAEQVYGKHRIARFGFAPVAAMMLLFIVGSFVLLVSRYRKLEVTR
jgi:ABC-2 type transport system permease protein